MADADTVYVVAKPTPARAIDDDRRTVVDALRARALDVVVLESTTAAEAERAARDAVHAGASRLIVIGGDGMVHLGLQAVAQTDTILGIVPAGTGNDFAGAMGLPEDLEAAVDVALGAPRSLDLLRVGERWAASVATFGFAADVNERANRLRFPPGSSRYTVATLLELPGMAPRHYRLDLDGEPLELDAVLVTVANTARFGGGMHISPAASPTDGLADLTVVGAASRLELLRFFGGVFHGSHLDHPKVTTHRARSVRLLTQDVPVWADGEPVATSPVTIEVVPDALRLACSGPTP